MAKTGVSMQLDIRPVRFVRGARPGFAPKLGIDDIPAVRALLRGDKGLAEMARELGVLPGALRYFIKRHQLCQNMQDRWRVIGYGRNAKLASSPGGK